MSGSFKYIVRYAYLLGAALIAITSLQSSAAFFESRIYEINEDEKEIVVTLKRSSEQGSVRLLLETVQHNAYANIHFKPISQQVNLATGQKEANLTIEVFDNPHVDGSKVLYLKATDVESLEEDMIKIVIHDNEYPMAMDKNFRPPKKVQRIFSELPDGKLLASMNQGLVRLNQDGSLDPEFYFEFDPEPGNETFQYLSHAIPLPDGSLLIAAELEQFNSGNQNFRTTLWKADANGVRDESFRVLTSRISFLDEVVVLPDGSIILMGAFENFNTGTFWYRMQKYSSDGKTDSTFEGDNLIPRNVPGVIDVEFFDEESLILVGRFSSIGGYAHHGVARMDFNGVVDPDFSFHLPEGAWVNRVRRLSDGSFLITGTWLSEDGNRERHIARYFTDGTEDRSFHLHELDFDDVPTDVQIDPDNQYVYVSGRFSHYQDIPIPKLVRLHLEHGTLDPSWTLPNRDEWINSGLLLFRSGMIYAGGERLYTDQIDRTGIQFEKLAKSTWTEGDESISIQINRLGSSPVPMTIQLKYMDSRGEAFDTIISAPEMVTLDAFQTSLEVPLEIENDPKVTGNRMLQVKARLLTDTQFGFEKDIASLTVVDKETPNMIDRSYVPGLSLDSNRYNPGYYTPSDAILLQDGGMLTINTGNGLEGLIKLQPNGERDAGFVVVSDAFARFEISTALQQPDGKILLGGFGSRSSGTQRPVLLRVDSETGELDAEFDVIQFLPGTTYGGNIQAIALQETPEGLKILAGGNVRSTAGRGLVRLNMDGTMDESFSMGVGFQGQYEDLQIRVVRVMPENKGLLVGGGFFQFNRVSRDSLAMLTNEGALVESFHPNLGQVYRVSDIELTDEGDIIVVGDFPDQDSDIIKMNAEGVVSTEFHGPSTNREIVQLERLSDGRLLVIGNFSEMNGAPRRGIARLLPNGAQDGSFLIGLRQGGGIDRMLMPDQNTLFLVGGMDLLDRVPVRGIVKIDLQSDPNRPGFSLGSFHRTLYVYEESADVSSSTEIHRLGASDQSFEIPYVVSSGSAVLGSDVRIHSESITMEVGQMSQIFEVSAVDDGLLESRENLEVRFDPQPGFPLWETVEIWVNDNEIPSVYDDTFQPVAMQSSSINQMMRLKDGAIAVGGWLSLEVTPSNFRTGMVIAGAEGGLDTSFSWPEPIQGTVYSMAETERGLLVGGSFSGDVVDAEGESHSVNSLVHLSRQGEVLDLELGSVSGGAVNAIAKDSSGRFVVGGYFNAIRGQRVANIARLNADGSVDSTFEIVSRPNGAVSQIGFQMDDRILITGGFSQVNRVNTGSVARLNEDGSFDESFHTDVTGHVEEMLVLSDDRILIAGGMSVPGMIDYTSMLLLQADGTLDTSFRAPEGLGGVHRLLVLSNGDLLVAGNFNELEGQSSMELVQLNLAGRPVTSPLWPSILGSGSVDVWDVIPVDKTTYLVGGGFSQLGFFPRYGLAQMRLETPSQTTLFLERASVSIPEGSSDRGFVLRRTGNVQQESSVTYSLQPQTARDGEDFEAVTATVTMASLELEKEVKLAAFEDDFPEPDETFLITLESSDPDTALGHAMQEVFIRDNDRVGSLDVSFQPSIQNVYTYREYAGDDGFGWDDDFGWGFGGSRWSEPLGDYEEITVTEEGSVQRVLVQPDQSLIVQGQFNLINGIPVINMARLFPDGHLDESFQLDQNESYQFESVFIQPEGDIVWRGNLSNRHGIYRLRSDGSLDGAFQSYQSTSPNYLEAIDMFRDGAILIREANYDVRGNYSMTLRKLHPNGTVDESFNLQARLTGNVWAMAILSDQSILIGGDFRRFEGVDARHLVRVLPNGELDANFPSFDPPNRRIQEMVALNDGSALVYGEFDQIAGIDMLETPSLPLFYNRWAMARIMFPSQEVMPLHYFNSRSFSLNLRRNVSQPGGGLLLSGDYEWGPYDVSGFQVWDMDREVPDERYDFGLGLSGWVEDAKFARNGDIYVAGNLDSFNGVNVGCLIRIHGEPATLIESVHLNAEGQLQITMPSLPGVEYALESSSDLVSWHVEFTVTASGELLEMTTSGMGGYRYFRIVRLH
jgi:uncharacterized delta-60 repeat protein